LGRSGCNADCLPLSGGRNDRLNIKAQELASAIFRWALTMAGSSPGGVWFFHQFIRSL
jgi:hypothetical protein